jgi:hypothetical protein
MPVAPLITAPFVVDHQIVEPRLGAMGPGTNQKATFELPTNINVLKSLAIRLRLGKMVLSTGSFCRYVDNVGLSCIEEINVRFGTGHLQKILPDAMFCKLYSYFDDEEKAKFNSLIGGALTPSQRSTRALAGAQEITVPLIAFLGVHLWGHPSQIIALRALGEQIRVEVVFRHRDYWTETDGTFTVNGTASASASLSDWVATGDSGLLVEGCYVTDQEQAALEQVYAKTHRHVFSDWQMNTNTSPLVYNLALDTLQTVTIPLSGINQPVKALYVLPRWTQDLNRTSATAAGTYGMNRYNLGGWYNAAGSYLPIFEYAEIRCGSNAYAVKRVRVEHLVDYEHARSFRGTRGPAIMKISFSHDPSRPNAVLGFQDFSQSDNPQLILYTRTQSSGVTIGSMAAADIGVANDSSATLTIDVYADTVSQVIISNHQISRPHN